MASFTFICSAKYTNLVQKPRKILMCCVYLARLFFSNRQRNMEDKIYSWIMYGCSVVCVLDT